MWEVFLLQPQTLALVRCSRSGDKTEITSQNTVQWPWRLLKCAVACM